MPNPSSMIAMVLEKRGASLAARHLPVPNPGPGEVLLRVRACGVCRTDLHIHDGELARGKLPVTMGHEIVGTVAAVGKNVTGFKIGERLGVPWLGWTCGECIYCRSGRENLCERARFTGYDRDGGYAEYVLADARFCLRLPSNYDAVHAAPLLCAGLIGYRALRFAGDAERIGFYGSLRRPISLRRLPWLKADACMRLRVRATKTHKASRANSAHTGRAARRKHLRSRWTRH